MAANMSYLLPPQSHDMEYGVKEFNMARTELTEIEAEEIMNIWGDDILPDPTLRYLDNQGRMSSVVRNVEDAWLFLQGADRSKWSYTVKLSNEFKIVEVKSHDEGTFNRLHDPTRPNFNVRKDNVDPYANRRGFVRQHLHLCGSGYACALSQQWPAFLPRIIIPIYGTVSSYFTSASSDVAICIPRSFEVSIDISEFQGQMLPVHDCIF